jgi:hypothetical protein
LRIPAICGIFAHPLQGISMQNSIAVAAVIVLSVLSGAASARDCGDEMSVGNAHATKWLSSRGRELTEQDVNDLRKQLKDMTEPVAIEILGAPDSVSRWEGNEASLIYQFGAGRLVIRISNGRICGVSVSDERQTGVRDDDFVGVGEGIGIQ